MIKHGLIAWTELNTRNPDSAARFFGTTIGWTFEAMPMEDGGTYWVAKMGQDMAAGIFTMSGPHFDGVPEHWFSYLEVDDVDARVAEVAAAGGIVKREPWTIPGVGRVAIVRAPGGATMGWMTSAARS